ncbi:MAG: hypothetical protein GY787_06640 [Alteromonadales bacterium]|nr:hypothetical protein [Alteromonadales bacterium]
MFRFINKIKIVFLVTPLLFACDDSETVNTADSPEPQQQINENQYVRMQQQANMGAFNYTKISSTEFVRDYFSLSQQVSSTEFMISEAQHFTIPENAVSFSLNFNNVLAGKDLFIGELQSPSGNIFALWDLIPCFDGTCSMVIPNRNDSLYSAEAGEWTYRVIAEKRAVENKQLNNTTINLLVRVNEQYDDSKLATIPVQPYYTGTQASADKITEIMAHFVRIFDDNDIIIDWKPAIHIEPKSFAVMEASYASLKTQTLMKYGKNNVVNIYFVERFSEIQEAEQALIHPRLAEEVRMLLGIAAGIPGSLGTTGDANGVMVSLGIYNDQAYIETSLIAATAAHEMGHFLGLFHTTEAAKVFNGPFDSFDPLLDTPNCKFTEAGELPPINTCPDIDNLMFPLAREDGQLSTNLTHDQRFILRNSPLAY